MTLASAVCCKDVKEYPKHTNRGNFAWFDSVKVIRNVDDV